MDTRKTSNATLVLNMGFLSNGYTYRMAILGMVKGFPYHNDILLPDKQSHNYQNAHPVTQCCLYIYNISRASHFAETYIHHIYSCIEPF